MRSVKLILCFFAALLVCARAQQESPPSRRVVIAASAVLDGKGRMLHNTRIVIEGSRIIAIDPKAAFAHAILAEARAPHLSRRGV